MKVCLLTETYHPEIGGGETQARAIAEGLVGLGHEVIVVTRRSRAGLPARETVGGVLVRRLRPSGRGPLRKWSLLVTALPALLAEGRRWDVVLTCGFRILGVPALVAARLRGRACVLKADSLGEMSGAYFSAGLRRVRLAPSSPPVRWFLGLRDALLRRADAFVAMSSAVEAELLDHGVDEARIERIPNSVDVRRFHPVAAERRRELRRELGLPAAGAIVTYAGRLVRPKGLPTLLAAWKRVLERRADATLVLVGEGGLDQHSCEGELRDAVAAGGLSERVVLAGAVDDPAPHLQASDAFAFPTEEEAFGLSALEALACGVPLVSTRVGGLADFVEHGRTALVVPAGDEAALADALDGILGDAGLAARLAAEGRRVAEQRFSQDVVVGRLAELLARMAAARRRRARGRP